MKQDKKLIDLFLRGYESDTKEQFTGTIYPDENDRTQRAVDAIATNLQRVRTAVEHTIVQPFPGQKQKFHSVLAAVFEPLRSETVPGVHLWVQADEDAVGTGRDWMAVGMDVMQWFRSAKGSFPEGWSEHQVPAVSPIVRLYVHCQVIKSYPGGTTVTYVRPITEADFVTVVRASLADKLQKLADAAADKRILLFQKEWRVYTHYELGRILDSIENDFPLLAKVDEVWLADTALCDTGGPLSFVGVWPCSSMSYRAFWGKCS